jgi:hypothetical protein
VLDPGCGSLLHLLQGVVLSTGMHMGASPFSAKRDNRMTKIQPSYINSTQHEADGALEVTNENAERKKSA